MASWTSGNPVSIGDPTKKSHGDVFFDNGQFERNLTTGAILATLLATFNAGITVATGTASLNTGATLGASLLTAGNTIQSTDAALPIIIGTGAGDDFTINTTGFIYEGDTGNVGIGGVPSGGRTIHAFADSASGIIQMQVSGAASEPSFILSNSTNTDQWQMVLKATDALQIIDNESGGIRLQIDSTGALSTGAEILPDVDPGGMCLNHGANDGNVMTFKNSDVAHGMTVRAETDTYALFEKLVATTGGLRLEGLSEADTAIFIQSDATTEDTTDDSSSTAGIVLASALKTGTNITSHTSTANILAVKNFGNTRFLIKGNGDIHATNTTITALDDKNDAEAVRDLTYHLAPKKWLSRALKYNKQELHDMGVITIDPNSDDIMMSFQGMFGLYGGAIGELHGVVNLLTEKLKEVGIATSYNALRKEFRDNQPALLS